MATQIRTNLLRQLANHLLSGELGHKYFDFTTFNYPEVKKCGTAGCAIGECPIAFPNDWHFNYSGMPVYKGFALKDSSQEFFNITPEQDMHLFMPSSQLMHKYGGTILRGNATKEQVANNILIFCDKADKGEF